VVVDGHYFPHTTKSSVPTLIADAKEGFEKMDLGEEKRNFPIDVSCPSCNHSLMDDSFYIEGRPSIRVTISFEEKHGWARLSSVYGRYNVYSEHEIPFKTIVHFFCPHCHGELAGTWDCPSCGAPMVSMIVRGG
jgi:hypothetical protein